MLSPMASWILFAAAADSLEISASPQAYIATSAGQEHDASHNTAQQFRTRLQNDGVVLVGLAFDDQGRDVLPYTLRVSRVWPASSALRPRGRSATLTVLSRGKNPMFSLVPLSVASTVRDRSQWKIFATTYKVALASDSLYELCRLPCFAPDTMKLIPSARVTKKW